jgi:hypothetical protein
MLSADGCCDGPEGRRGGRAVQIPVRDERDNDGDAARDRLGCPAVMTYQYLPASLDTVPPVSDLGRRHGGEHGQREPVQMPVGYLKKHLPGLPVGDRPDQRSSPPVWDLAARAVLWDKGCARHFDALPSAQALAVATQQDPFALAGYEQAAETGKQHAAIADRDIQFELDAKPHCRRGGGTCQIAEIGRRSLVNAGKTIVRPASDVRQGYQRGNDARIDCLQLGQELVARPEGGSRGIGPVGCPSHDMKQHQMLAELRIVQITDHRSVPDAAGQCHERVRRQRMGGDQGWTFPPDQDQVRPRSSRRRNSGVHRFP